MSANTAVKKWIFVLIPAIIVLLAAGAILLGILRQTPQMPPAPQQVRLETVRVLPASSILRAVALVEADQSVELKARVSGFLVGKDFEEGKPVRAGQILFRIEPDQYKSAVSSAQARLEQAQLNLEYTAIRAPFDGFVSDTPFSVGSLLGPESPTLATVVASDPVEVSFGLSDKVMGGVRLGDERSGLPGGRLDNVRPRLIFGSGAYYELDGQISYVAPQVERQTDTVKFKARFDNPKGVLAPGQSVVVSLEPVEPRNVLILPKAALMTSQGEGFVYMAGPAPGGGNNGLVAVSRPVEIGYEFEEGFEVLSGLSEGDQVMVMGLMSSGARLRAGSPVTVSEAVGQASGAADGQPPEAAAGQAGVD
jgi:membrane fusion protein (multidrug efflux system)